ncbi:hypothetical protein R1sor_018646 [Riccia sorocarpa]|uniref:non-specific serine/threonine protein kinase n=1 Tax=Riccia sorocarpa TaxID=122646 RepID=A0ABD3IGI3_9MARC
MGPPMCKFLKALFLGMVYRTKWRGTGSSKSRRKARNGGQIFSVGDYNEEFSKQAEEYANKFDNADLFGVLGSVGTIGTVFWGRLADGSEIAVKKLDASKTKGVKEFTAHAELLGSFRHKNILTLRGYCAEGKERLLVYEYMINLSLHSHLHGSSSATLAMNWGRRMTVAIGAAEGLMYLHHKASPPTVHGDIKSKNILLDKNYEAKWMDFGLMKLMQDTWVQQCSKENGALGMYSAPEYMKGKERSLSGDVFGFGILLLEIISGREPLMADTTTKKSKSKSMSFFKSKSKSKPTESKSKSMWEWAEPIIAEGRFNELVDPRLKGQYAKDELNLVVYVATMCVQSQPGSRLTMMEAVDLLRCGNVCRDHADDDMYDDYDMEFWNMS